MREIRQSGSEGGVAGNGHPYPYTSPGCNPGYGFVDRWRSVGTPHRAHVGGRSGDMLRSFSARNGCDEDPRALPHQAGIRPSTIHWDCPNGGNQGVTVPVDVWGGSMRRVISTHEIIGLIRRKTMVPPVAWPYPAIHQCNRSRR
jgi:hypothetical protein